LRRLSPGANRRNMRLLLFNLATDVDDPILGFTTRWIAALAARVEFVHVLTMRVGRIEVPGNVQVDSVGKENGYSEARRATEFYRHLARILREERIDVCFSHMIPIFTLLAAPLLRRRRVPVVTWYCHPTLSWTLKLAHHLSNDMVSSFATSYPYRRDKLTVVGHGIDTDLFKPLDFATAEEDPPMILCVGRLSPLKDHPTLLRAASLLRQSWHRPFRVVIVGGPATSRDEAYLRLLQEQVKELGLETTVQFEPAVVMEKLPSWYRRCAVHVNLSPTGGGDKVALEAMACGRPSLVANEGFRDTLDLYASRLQFPHGSADGLAERLKWVLSLTNKGRARVGAFLRDGVVAQHSLNRLADQLVHLLESKILSTRVFGVPAKSPDELRTGNV
jgi:glycosyltransferase involved in cell wall biosynthesis